MKKFCLILVFLISVSNIVKAAEIKAEPSLIITTFDGKNFNLKEKRGKVVLISFWAKWCIDCRKEMPILNEIYQKYKSRNLEIIGINIEQKRERKEVLELSSSVSYSNAMLYEATETSFEEPDSVPINYVIDKKGNLAATISPDDDELTKDDFEKIIKPLL